MFYVMPFMVYFLLRKLLGPFGLPALSPLPVLKLTSLFWLYGFFFFELMCQSVLKCMDMYISFKSASYVFLPKTMIFDIHISSP